MLAQVNAPVIGLVLNGMPESAQYSYGYGRSYDKGDAPPSKKDRKAKAKQKSGPARMRV